jgi:hypothetical protein
VGFEDVILKVKLGLALPFCQLLIRTQTPRAPQFCCFKPKKTTSQASLQSVLTELHRESAVCAHLKITVFWDVKYQAISASKER